jgi:drug/metabolite transporter (DMT)-like permease
MTAVPLALASAWALAVGTVLAHRASSTAQTSGGGVLRRAGRLVRRPAFLGAQIAGAVGLALHGAALATGPVVVVQPLLCTGLVMALLLGAALDRRHPHRPLPHRRQWIAAVLVVVGLALFLVTAAPTAGSGHATGPALPLAVAAFGAVAAAVATGVRRSRVPHAAAALGAVAGAGFGLTGVLLKVVVLLPATSWPTAWPSYALVGVGAVATAVAQWSYSSGPLVQSQPVLTALEPVVALVLAGPVFAEGVAGGPVAHAGELTGLLLLVAGVVEVARHAVPPTSPEASPATPVAAARSMSALTVVSLGTSRIQAAVRPSR